MTKRAWAGILAGILVMMLCACTDRWTALLFPEAEQNPEDERILLTVGDRELPAWQVRAWLLREKEAVGTADWTAGARTAADEAEDRAFADMALCAAVETMAEENGLAVTEEDRTILRAHWAEECRQWGGEEAYLQRMGRTGLNRERWERIAQTGVLYGKLSTLERQGALQGLSAPEAFSREGGEVWRVSVPYGEDREGAYERAAEIFARLNGAEEQASLFQQLCAETGGGVLERDGDGEELRAAAALDVGELSGVLAGETGYSILLRMEPDRPEPAEDWLDQELERRAGGLRLVLREGYEALANEVFSQAVS